MKFILETGIRMSCLQLQFEKSYQNFTSVQVNEKLMYSMT